VPGTGIVAAVVARMSENSLEFARGVALTADAEGLD
jgi:hypothetical protein